MVSHAGVSYYCLKFRVCYSSITNAGNSNIKLVPLRAKQALGEAQV